VAQDRNALQLLVGAPLPQDLSDGPPLEAQSFWKSCRQAAVGLLERRPDILSAERNLRAANANIGAARAAFFPSVSLTGLFGTSSGQLSGLFGNGSKSWSFNPQLSCRSSPGANIANLDLAKVQKNVQVAQYEKSIQTAFREVADALAARGTLQQQREASVRWWMPRAPLQALRDALPKRGGRLSHRPGFTAHVVQCSAGLVSVELTRLEIWSVCIRHWVAVGRGGLEGRAWPANGGERAQADLDSYPDRRSCMSLGLRFGRMRPSLDPEVWSRMP